MLSGAAAARPAVSHDITLTLDAESGALSLVDVLTVTHGGRLSVDLAPWMSLTALRLDGTAVRKPLFGSRLSFDLTGSSPHRIEIAASGALKRLRQKDGRFQSRPFFDTDGLYLPHWSGWFPKVENADLSYRLTVVTTAGFRVAATATLVSEDLGGTNRAVFEGVAGNPEPPSLFAGPYEVAEGAADGVTLRTYFHADQASLAPVYLEATAAFIKRFDAAIGAYPFKDFNVVSAPVPAGLGFPNLTYIGRRILHLPFMRGRSLAHEVLHNWWGNGVVPDYRAGNWSEGLTTYMADHDLAASDDPAKARELRLSWLRDYAALPKDDDMAVTGFVSKEHDASQIIGYGKVAFIFHMLKTEIGADAFDAAIRTFWRRHRFKSANWTDIRESFESVTSTDLKPFFDQWTNRSGAPRLALAGVETVRDGAGYALVIRLTQSAPTYRLTVPIEITTETGDRREVASVDAEETVITVKLDARPLSLRVDPDHDLFRHLLPGEAPPILRDVLLDRDAGTVTLYTDPRTRDVAEELSGRLFRGARRSVIPNKGNGLGDAPLIVFGARADIASFIETFGIEPAPGFADAGTARVWVVRHRDTAVAFVSADDVASLEALIRPLPHYRSKSFIVFDGRRAVESGVWRRTSSPMNVTIGDGGSR